MLHRNTIINSNIGVKYKNQTYIIYNTKTKETNDEAQVCELLKLWQIIMCY